MKKILTIIPLIILTLSVKGQFEYLKYPAYDIVISKFYSNYSVQNIPDNCEINFEKRPTGWNILLIEDQDEQKIIKSELFWDRESEKFKKIAFDKIKVKGENQERINKLTNEWSKIYYYFCPYWGYPTWNWDIIQNYKDKENLPDSILYALGRAYSSYASNLLLDDYGRKSSNILFDLPQGKNSMTNEQLEKYRYYRHLAIETFNKLAILNPNFETIVGLIGTKASNEYITSFLDMRMYQNEQEAKKEIVSGLYNDFNISTAKNYLNSCAPDAILLTYGDNDTYPLLYVQEQYGFRTDVLVINSSLLQIDRYVNSLREQILDANGIPLSLTPDEISGDNRSVITIENESDQPIELTELIRFIKNEEHTKSYGEINYYYCPTKKLRLMHGNDFVDWQVDQRYFGRNYLVILDMLATNKWSRPIYFSSVSTVIGLDDYLVQDGLALRLTPTKRDTNSEKHICLNSAVLYSNLMIKFDWKGIDKVTSHEKGFCLYYRNLFYLLADDLLDKNELDSAKLVLDKCLELMPNEIVYFDRWTIPIIECYYRLKDFNKANEIAKVLAFNLKNKIDIFKGLRMIIFNDETNEGISNLKELAKKYNQQEILKILE